jgi:hypothetical protein
VKEEKMAVVKRQRSPTTINAIAGKRFKMADGRECIDLDSDGEEDAVGKEGPICSKNVKAESGAESDIFTLDD